MTAGPTRQGTRGLTLREAAEVLGISKEAARKRVRRGSLPSAKGADGRVYVYLPAGGDAGADASPGDGEAQDPVPRGGDLDLRDHLIAELRAEVEAWREESRRKDHIIAGLVERVPALEAPRGERDGPESAAGDPDRSEPRPATGGAQEAAERRSWWQRWFGV